MDARLLALAVAVLAVAARGASAACLAPQGQPQGGRGDAEPTPQELCTIFGGQSCAGRAAFPAIDLRLAGPSQGPSQGPRRRARQAPQLDQKQVCDIFGGPSCPSEPGTVQEPCTCRGGGAQCVCVPHYSCRKQQQQQPGGQDADDDAGTIDIRQQVKDNSTCDHYLHECCDVDLVDAVPAGPSSQPQQQAPSPPEVLAAVPAGPQQCGVRHRNGVGTRISGGFNDESNFGEIPWMVAVFRRRAGKNEYLCGGGLVAENVVLTAAHCIVNNDATGASLSVRAGEWDSRTELELYKHQDRDVDNVIVHPDYKRKTLYNNVALLVLREPVTLGYHVGTICLPEQGQSFDHQSCLVSGWGKDKFGKDGVYQNILRLIEDLPVVPHAQCESMLRRTRLGSKFNLDKTFLCAGGVQGRDACTGDGGSPLVCPLTEDDDTRYVYAGIVSWGIGCGTADVPGVYADVAMFRTWIEETLAPYNVDLPCSL